MKPVEGLRTSGTFKVAGTEVQGDLILEGSNTTLDLYAKEFFDPHHPQQDCILGVLRDLTRVSLIDCITTEGPSTGMLGNESFHFSRVFPHFIIFGTEHVTGAEKKIRSVSFHVEDAAILFYDFDAFGRVSNPGQNTAEIVASAKHAYGKDIAVGEEPMLFYFNGKFEIFKAATSLGVVTAEHRPSFSSPGPHGININNKIWVNLAFGEDVVLSTAVNSVRRLLRFLEIIAGRSQTLRQLRVVTVGSESKPNFLDVYWSLAPSRGIEHDEFRPHPADLPIQAARTPEDFASVLTSWLARDDEWQNARVRFSTVFALQNRITIDRVVAAANMFDILPSSAVPQDVPLAKGLQAAKWTSRAIFKALPDSPERNSVLGALGRLGKANLKQKVRARAKPILDHIAGWFPELEFVIDEAVDCRNYFVHGSEPKMDYAGNSDLMMFFTEALEFIFAASDLIECGWNIDEWAKHGSSVSHPFDKFRIDYEVRLEHLKKTLSAAKKTLN